VVVVSPCLGMDSEVIRKGLVVFQDHITGDIKIAGRTLPVVAAGERTVSYIAFRFLPVPSKPILIYAIANGGGELVGDAVIERHRSENIILIIALQVFVRLEVRVVIPRRIVMPLLYALLP